MCSDTWVDGKCAFCGSVAPDRLVDLLLDGAYVIPTDKKDKIYIRSNTRIEKFYLNHLTV